MAKIDNNDEVRDRALSVMYARSEAEKKAKKKKKREKAKKDGRGEKASETVKPKRKLDTKRLVAVITVIFLIGAAVGLFFLIKSEADKKAEEEREATFDYLTSDLAEYIYFPADKSYKDFTVNIALAKPHTETVDGAGVVTGVSDVKETILQIIASERELVGDGTKNVNGVAGIGDNVYIWYRGYLVDPETGEEIVIGVSNFSNASSSELGIGTGYFPAVGVESALVGFDTSEYARFVKITTGEIDPTKHIAYVDFTRTPRDENGDLVSSGKETRKGVRIDLSDTETIKETFGDSFLASITTKTADGKIVPRNVGETLSFSTKIDGKDYSYSATKVNFVTTCEKEETNGGKPIKTVEGYFPYNYAGSSNLRNETAYFEIYVEYVQDYTVPEWNETFLREYLADRKDLLTPEKIDEEYEGENLLEKFEKYVYDVLMEDYEEERESLIEDAVWQYYLKNVKVKKYPKLKVNDVYGEYVEDVYTQFEKTGGMLQNSSTGEYETFSDVDEFAVAYLGISENQNWQVYLKSLAESLVKERLILYYIMRQEKLTPTEKALGDKYDALRKEYSEEYLEQWLAQEDKTKEDCISDAYADVKKEKGEQYIKDYMAEHSLTLEKYHEELWQEFLAARDKELFDYYDEDYFTETAYYEILIETVLKWPKVNDLEDGSYTYPSEVETK